MVTPQEYLSNKYPTKEDKEQVQEIDIGKIYQELDKQVPAEKLSGGELDLREYVNLEEIHIYKIYLTSQLTKLTCGQQLKLTYLCCSDNQLTDLDLSNCYNLTYLFCPFNQFSSIDFLTQLPQPGKLNILSIFNNNISVTDIAVFNRFVNLKHLKLGTTSKGLIEGWRNKLYGSFQAWKDLTKLRNICIEATDVSEGLEYLPFSLAKATKGWGYTNIECSPHNTTAQCSTIQNELRPYNYNLLAWQLAHPELMLKTRPEYFTNLDSSEQWLTALKNKIQSSQETLTYLLENETDSTAKIIRLETQIKILEEVKNQLNQQITTEREIHEEAMKTMDNWCHQLPPRDNNLKNILSNFADDYLKLNRENQNLVQENQKLKQNIEANNKILEQRFPEKETREQGTQTELTGEKLEQQQKENRELKEQINKLIIEKK